MQLYLKGALCACAVIGVSACSTDIFSYSTASSEAKSPAQSGPRQAEAPLHPGIESRCLSVATQRANDAVMALYVTEDSQGQKDIQNETYRDCVNWENQRVAGK